jgi:hypothetical protein
LNDLFLTATIYPAAALTAPRPLLSQEESLRNVENFLTELAESRQREQSAARAGFMFPRDLCLPAELETAIEHRLPIAPMLALSPYAPRSTRAGFPSFDRDQIEYWFARYGAEGTNWVLDLDEESSIVAIRSALEFYGLPFRLPEEYRALKRTLRVQAKTTSYALFRVPPGRKLSTAWFHGLCWHTWIPLPPSRLVRESGEEIVFTYADPGAPLLTAPESILGIPSQKQ